jgi:hypothetical protein
MLPGTVGPAKGNGEAAFIEAIAAINAAPNRLLRKRGCTRRSGSVCYAIISLDAKQKIPAPGFCRAQKFQEPDPAYGNNFCCSKGRSRLISPTRRAKMPQLDFRQAFSTSAETADIASPQPVPAASAQNKPASFSRTARLSRSSWTNISFVAVTFLGGLFCVFYFFNGAELLRAALSWPREYLYQRPGALAQSEMNDKVQPFGEQGWPLTQNSGTSSGPFGRVGGMNLGPSPAFTSPSAGSPGNGSVASAPFSNSGSLLGQLGVPLPGPDGLMQTFNRAVDDLVRARQLDARRTVVVVQSVVKETRARVSAKNTTKGARNAATNAIGQASQDSQQSTQATAGAAQNQTAAAVRTTNSVTQGTMNSIRGLGSRPMGGLGSFHSPVSLPGGRR